MTTAATSAREAKHGREIHVGAVVLNGVRALFVRQTPSHSLGPVWTIPWGTLEPGESPSVAAIREVLEEARIAATIEGLLGVQELPAPWAGTLALVFLCRHVAGEPTPDGLETDAARYLSLAELRSSAEPFEPWCRWLTERVLDGHCAALRAASDNPFHPQDGFVAEIPSWHK